MTLAKKYPTTRVAWAVLSNFRKRESRGRLLQSIRLASLVAGAYCAWAILIVLELGL